MATRPRLHEPETTGSPMRWPWRVTVWCYALPDFLQLFATKAKGLEPVRLVMN